MKVKYYNNFSRKKINVRVNSDVAKYLTENKREMRRIERYETGVIVSLDELTDAGFQPVDPVLLEERINLQEKEKKYLNSRRYKSFRKSLQHEISKKMDMMSDKVKIAMYLRFFENMSLSQIAKEMNIAIWTVRTHLERGTSYIKKFLEEDIKREDEKERNRKYENLKKQHK